MDVLMSVDVFMSVRKNATNGNCIQDVCEYDATIKANTIQASVINVL